MFVLNVWFFCSSDFSPHLLNNLMLRGVYAEDFHVYSLRFSDLKIINGDYSQIPFFAKICGIIISFISITHSKIFNSVGLPTFSCLCIKVTHENGEVSGFELARIDFTSMWNFSGSSSSLAAVGTVFNLLISTYKHLY